MDWDHRRCTFYQHFDVPDQRPDHELVLSKRAGLDIRKFWKETLPIIIATLLLTTGALLLKHFLVSESAGSFLTFGVEVVLYTALYGIVMLKIVADRSEKEQFLQIVTSLTLTLKRK